MKLKITAAQIIALRSATMRDNGSYELTTAKGQTVNALTRVGILVSGTRFLTVQGVSVMHSVRDVSVIASKGHTTYVSDSPESLELFTLPARESNTVTIQGEWEEPRTMVDPDGNTIPYDAFLSMAMQDAARIEADGGCVGLCAVGTGCAHCDEQYGPESSYADAESVSEAVEGDTVEPFVFVPGIHALDMGDKGYNRFAGIGESSAVAGSLYTFGLSVAISAHPGMNGTGKTNIPCEFGDVITVRTSIGDKRFVIEDNRYSATGPRKGDPILTPYTTDDARCVRCETHGDNSMPGKNIGGEWVCGYCVENTESDESAREFPCFKRMGVVTHKGECSETRNENGPVCSLENDESESDGGFIETVDYGTVARLTTGAGFHTLNAPSENVSTGTTHHTTDTDGNTWERFDHVLTVGDVVKAVGTPGLFTVYALIPGLPVVYLDAHDGREPFPMGASKVYAL